jgi:hypothetical protein
MKRIALLLVVRCLCVHPVLAGQPAIDRTIKKERNCSRGTPKKPFGVAG